MREIFRYLKVNWFVLIRQFLETWSYWFKLTTLLGLGYIFASYGLICSAILVILPIIIDTSFIVYDAVQVYALTQELNRTFGNNFNNCNV